MSNFSYNFNESFLYFASALVMVSKCCCFLWGFLCLFLWGIMLLFFLGWGSSFPNQYQNSFST